MWPVRHAFVSLKNPTGLARQPLRWRSTDDPLPTETKRLVFFGDLMRMYKERLPRVDEPLRALFQSTDLVVGNCEGPVIHQQMVGRHVWSFNLSLAQEYLTQILARLGINTDTCVLSLANNHIGDHGTDGLQKTLAALESLGIRHTGTTRERALKASVGNWQLGLAAWTWWENYPLPRQDLSVWRNEDSTGTDWAKWRRDNQIDYLVGSPHWGYEFEHFPRAETRQNGQDLLAQGFDLLVGHHPHVLQGIERSDEGFSFYSLGNFYALQMIWPARISAVLEILLAPNGDDQRPMVIGYELHPCLLTGQHGSPAISMLDHLPARLQKRYRTRLQCVFDL
jgi:poly-gamma-glutamate synthesis protein (capsule biosynthesis protein)